MDFSDALHQIKQGEMVLRTGWNATNQYVQLSPQLDDDRPPHIEIHTVQKTFVPWAPSQTDLLAEDWELTE